MKKFLLLIIICIILSPLLTLANADLNNDGNIDISDLVIVASDFGKSSGYNQAVDTDSNNVIDIFDIVYIASRFGTTPPEPPEPPPIGNIIYAASLSQVDIQAAVDAANDGDTVILPSGTNSNFAGTVTVTKAIHIKGQGKDTTVLERSSVAGPIFKFEPSSSDKEWEISDLTIRGTNTQSGESGILVDASSDNFRIHDMKVEGFGYYGIGINYYSTGVIWNCDFKDNMMPGYGYAVQVMGTKTGDSSMGDWSYNQPLSLGTSDAVFIEDCTFENSRHYIMSRRGARYVFRHNSITANSYDHSIDTHGDYPGTSRGARQFEVYNNTVNCVTQEFVCGFHSGSGVVHNNVVTDIKYQNQFIVFQNGCCMSDTCSPYPEADQTTGVWVWENTVNGESYNSPRSSSQCQPIGLFQEGRDWFEYEKPSYTPYPYPHPLRGS